jgi:uroporphyrinogen decarboxylase
MDRVGETPEGYSVFRSVLGEEHAVTALGSKLTRPALEDPSQAGEWSAPDRSTCRTGLLDFFRPRWDGALFAQIGGPVSTLDWMLGTERFLEATVTHPEKMVLLAEKVTGYEVERAKIFLDHGADVILMTDDIAYQRGPFLSPRTMQRIAWPLYREMLSAIKAHRDVPVFLHTDGDIRPLLEEIVSCGFDGLHSLQPSAGMDIHEVKERYGDRLCLMGNLDLDRLMPFGTPEEVEREARALCEKVGRGGGFILSTCNILTHALPVENVRAMYRLEV